MIPLSYSLLVYIDREGDDGGVGTSARRGSDASPSRIKDEVDEFNYDWFYSACHDDDLD
jgi:hypothetical protein